MKPVFLVLSLHQLKELTEAIYSARGKDAPDSACVVLNGFAMPPKETDSSLITSVSYKASLTGESKNLF